MKGLSCLPLLLFGTVAAAAPRPLSTGEQAVLNFGFAHQLGSGVYSLSGRTAERRDRIRPVAEPRRVQRRARHRVRPCSGRPRAPAAATTPNAAPAGPAGEIDTADDLQFEVGFAFGATETIRIWRIPLPRLGCGYRCCGDGPAV